MSVYCTISFEASPRCNLSSGRDIRLAGFERPAMAYQTYRNQKNEKFTGRPLALTFFV
jgi:hypothetical protein